jgi:hypothetical protein
MSKIIDTTRDSNIASEGEEQNKENEARERRIVHVSAAGGLLTQRTLKEALPAGRRWLVIEAL